MPRREAKCASASRVSALDRLESAFPPDSGSKVAEA